jgi:hypothetical protein
MKLNPTAITLALALISALASAQTTATPQSVGTAEVLQRDVNQQTRIRNGVAQGQLTRWAAARLEAGQARSESEEWLAGRDGHVGVAEAANVDHAALRKG